MQKTEFSKPAARPGEKAEPSISVDADKLYRLLLRAELMMNAVNRRRYADRAIDQILDVIKEFTLAHDFELDRYEHNDILIRKYGFKFNKLKHKHNDKTRNRR